MSYLDNDKEEALKIKNYDWYIKILKKEADKFIISTDEECEKILKNIPISELAKYAIRTAGTYSRLRQNELLKEQIKELKQREEGREWVDNYLRNNYKKPESVKDKILRLYVKKEGIFNNEKENHNNDEPMPF